MTSTQWICCQLGAREHYAVPRALHRRARLRMMVTDAWTRPGSPIAHLPGQLPRRLAERYHPDLESADVRDLTLALMTQEVEWRLQRRTGWDLLIARNEWFQAGAASVLTDVEKPSPARIVVFAHSYAARAIFQLAKTRGWITVLGQIDPGEDHFAIVRRLADASPQYGAAPSLPPIDYFERWREECALADHIVVNSEWSRKAVIRAGVDSARLRVMPLAYDGSAEPPPAPRAFPDRFTAARPLRLLFVGSASVVKGAPQLLEAMSLLAGQPVTLRLVGEPAMTVPASFLSHPGIEWIGAVPRGEMAQHYETSDVLVFPSHSDGFGMAQIEAQGHGLPVIASPFCGGVVRDGHNGLLLADVSAHSIAGAIRSLLNTPALLGRLSGNAVVGGEDALIRLGAELMRLVKT